MPADAVTRLKPVPFGFEKPLEDSEIDVRVGPMLGAGIYQEAGETMSRFAESTNPVEMEWFKEAQTLLWKDYPGYVPPDA